MVVWGHDLVPARTLVASARAASSEFEQFADERTSTLIPVCQSLMAHPLGDLNLPLIRKSAAKSMSIGDGSQEASLWSTMTA